MEPVSAPVTPVPGPPAPPARQRWRLVLARSADAPRLAGRELVDLWDTAIDSSGLPVHRPAGRVRPRLAFGAPIQLGIAAERELADLFLSELAPIWRVRGVLANVMPEGWRLVDLFDTWMGGPALAGLVVAADYRIELAGEPDLAGLKAAAAQLLAAGQLPRVRTKGDGTVPYDLRPLLADVSVHPAAGRIALRVRTRFHPTLGTGRPEEVVAAIDARIEAALQVVAIVRERLILSNESGRSAGPSGSVRSWQTQILNK